jgi:succinoglycan biosynthesis transport protein ExoP
VNLALTFARSGKRVVLIDADMRRPSVHKLLGLDNAMGLSMFLAGVSTDAMIKKISEPHLQVITAGPVPPNPSELLVSLRMAELMTTLKKNVDMVIIDSPPVISVTDALLLGKITDATIIVTRAASTSHEVMGRGLKALKDVDIHVIGVVLNAVDMKKSGYYYGYENYYYTAE